MFIWGDGFDHYTSGELAKKWWDYTGSSAYIVNAGRFGGKSLRFDNNGDSVLKLFSSNYSTLIAGFAFFMSGTRADLTFFGFLDGGATEQIGLRCEWNDWGVSRIQVVRGDGTVLGTSTSYVPINTWNWLEFKVTFHNSSGAFELRINGVTECSASGVDTCNTANNSANCIRMRAMRTFANQVYFDDLVICDTSGARMNDFFGEMSVQTAMPDANGVTNQFTPSAGSNYQNVDDSGDIDDDSTYNKSSTFGHIDLYGFPDWDTSRTIHVVQATMIVRRDDTGLRKVKPLCRSGGTNYQGSEAALSASYLGYINLLIDDPATAAQWTAANLNAAQFGIEVTA